MVTKELVSEIRSFLYSLDWKQERADQTSMRAAGYLELDEIKTLRKYLKEVIKDLVW